MKSQAVFLIAAVLCAVPAVRAGAGEPVRRDPAPVRTTPFPDVPRDHWAFDAVEQLRQRGILRGYPPAPRKPAEAGASSIRRQNPRTQRRLRR